MPDSLSKADVTGLLRRWRDEGGSPDDRLIRAVEGELGRIAAGYMRRERADHTLQRGSGRRADRSISKV